MHHNCYIIGIIDDIGCYQFAAWMGGWAFLPCKVLWQANAYGDWQQDGEARWSDKIYCSSLWEVNIFLFCVLEFLFYCCYQGLWHEIYIKKTWWAIPLYYPSHNQLALTFHMSLLIWSWIPAENKTWPFVYTFIKINLQANKMLTFSWAAPALLRVNCSFMPICWRPVLSSSALHSYSGF